MAESSLNHTWNNFECIYKCIQTQEPVGTRLLRMVFDHTINFLLECVSALCRICNLLHNRLIWSLLYVIGCILGRVQRSSYITRSCNIMHAWWWQWWPFFIHKNRPTDWRSIADVQREYIMRHFICKHVYLGQTVVRTCITFVGIWGRQETQVYRPFRTFKTRASIILDRPTF